MDVQPWGPSPAHPINYLKRLKQSLSSSTDSEHSIRRQTLLLHRMHASARSSEPNDPPPHKLASWEQAPLTAQQASSSRLNFQRMLMLTTRSSTSDMLAILSRRPVLKSSNLKRSSWRNWSANDLTKNYLPSNWLAVLHSANYSPTSSPPASREMQCRRSQGAVCDQARAVCAALAKQPPCVPTQARHVWKPSDLQCDYRITAKIPQSQKSLKLRTSQRSPLPLMNRQSPLLRCHRSRPARQKTNSKPYSHLIDINRSQYTYASSLRSKKSYVVHLEKMLLDEINQRKKLQEEIKQIQAFN